MEYHELVEEFGFDMWPVGDRQKGRIGSPMPAWYFDGHLEEEIRNLDNQKAIVASGGVSQENLNTIKQQIAREQMKIDMIKNSFPKPDQKHKDKLYSLWKELSQVIGDSMFTYSDMESGRANPHEELKRAKDPIIPISRNLARLIIYCNGQVFGGEEGSFRIKRDDGVRAWKIVGRILGESTWVEDLRPAERPAGARRGNYRETFTGFEPEVPEGIVIEEKPPQLQEPQLADGADLLDEPEEQEPRTCIECNDPLPKEAHHLTKYCAYCKEERTQDGRKDSNKDVSGGT